MLQLYRVKCRTSEQMQVSWGDACLRGQQQWWPGVYFVGSMAVLFKLSDRCSIGQYFAKGRRQHTI